MSAYVALLTIDLHFPEAHSLKGKRKELSSVKAQLHTRLGCAVAEVDHQDTWQRATLAAALVERLGRRARARLRRGRALPRGPLPVGRARRARDRVSPTIWQTD